MKGLKLCNNNRKKAIVILLTQKKNLRWINDKRNSPSGRFENHECMYMFQTTEPWDILLILQGEMDRFTIFVGDTDTALLEINRLRNF